MYALCVYGELVGVFTYEDTANWYGELHYAQETYRVYPLEFLTYVNQQTLTEAQDVQSGTRD